MLQLSLVLCTTCVHRRCLSSRAPPTGTGAPPCSQCSGLGAIRAHCATRARARVYCRNHLEQNKTLSPQPNQEGCFYTDRRARQNLGRAVPSGCNQSWGTCISFFLQSCILRACRSAPGRPRSSCPRTTSLDPARTNISQRASTKRSTYWRAHSRTIAAAATAAQAREHVDANSKQGGEVHQITLISSESLRPGPYCCS